jgi:hypothetical protein
MQNPKEYLESGRTDAWTFIEPLEASETAPVRKSYKLVGDILNIGERKFPHTDFYILKTLPPKEKKSMLQLLTISKDFEARESNLREEVKFWRREVKPLIQSPKFAKATVSFPAAEGVGDAYLDPFFDAINGANYILALGDDWDEQGARGYQKKTLDRACRFLIGFVNKVHKRYGIKLEVPKVLPGPDGGIDIHWKNDRFEMLVEIPEEGDFADYFGDNTQGEETKGRMRIENPRLNHGLLLWLSQ